MALPKFSSHKLKRIAVYRACGLGDAAQITPLFQQIHVNCPEAEVHFFTSKGIPDLFEGSQYLHACHAFAIETLKSRAMGFGGFPVWREIGRQGPWDLVMNLDFLFRLSLFLPLTRSRWKAGLQSMRRRFYSPYDSFLRLDPDEGQNQDQGHASLTYLRLWEAATGFQDLGFGYDLRHLLSRNTEPLPGNLPSNFVCLAPATGNVFNRIPTKQWPFSHWKELATLISESGMTVVWIGTAEEQAAFNPPQIGINLMGRVNLAQLAKLLAAATICVAHDSGPFHLALAVGGRALGIYGSTSVTRLGPFRAPTGFTIQETLPCVPCLKSECLVQLPDFSEYSRPYCMTKLTPRAVFNRLGSCLKDKSGG